MWLNKMVIKMIFKLYALYYLDKGDIQLQEFGIN